MLYGDACERYCFLDAAYAISLNSVNSRLGPAVWSLEEFIFLSVHTHTLSLEDLYILSRNGIFQCIFSRLLQRSAIVVQCRLSATPSVVSKQL